MTPETCLYCHMNTAYGQRVPLWLSDNQGTVEYECANCRRSFTRIKFTGDMPHHLRMQKVLEQESMQIQMEDDPYAWSPYSYHGPTKRSSIIKVSNGNAMSAKERNRKRVTASLDEMGETSVNVSSGEGFTIEETNLEIKKEEEQ